MNLNEFDLIVINSSGGKDSQTALRKVALMAKDQGVPNHRIVVSHQDLGESEWEGVYELVKEQANYYGFHVLLSRYRNKDKDELSLLNYVEKRKMWPSSTTRFCTSEFKRSPGERTIRGLTSDRTRNYKVLNVMGFRAEESPARAKREVLSVNKRMSTQNREVVDWLPIHDWTVGDVWKDIKSSGVRHHWAYDNGMPRLSCVFCIFANEHALRLAGSLNPDLLNKYVDLEDKIGHTFKSDLSLRKVKEDLESGVTVEPVEDWAM